MTKKERLLKAIRRETPDVVPVSPVIDYRFAHKITGRTDMDAIVEAHRAVGSSVFNLRLSIPFETSWEEGFYERANVIREDGGITRFTTDIGTPAGMLHSEVIAGFLPTDPVLTKKTEHLIKNTDDYRIYRQYLEKWLENAKPNIEEVDRIFHNVGEDGIANVYQQSAFASLCEARGMEDVLTEFYDHPDLMRDMLGLARLVVKKRLEAFNECLSEVVIHDVAWASTSLVSPKFFEKWVLDDICEAVRQVKGGKYIGFYMSGKSRDVIPMMVQSGGDFVQSLDTVDGDCSLKEVKQTFGDRVCVMGNYSPVVLAYGTPEEARQEALRCLEEGAAGGGYVVMTGDETPADAKLENVRTMIETIERHGRYSLREGRG